MFAEEEEQPAAEPPAKPKGGKKFAVFAEEEAEPAAEPVAKPKGGKKFAVFAEEEPAATVSTDAQAVPLPEMPSSCQHQPVMLRQMECC